MKAHHRPVRYLDAAEPMPFAQFDALAKPVVRANHPAADVFGITEAAESHSFKLRRAGSARQF